MADPVDFRYPETAAMLKKLQNADPDTAETAYGVDLDKWEGYLHKLPLDLKCSIQAIDGKLSRNQLWELADRSRARPDDLAALSTFFWNVQAWGINGDWRWVGRIRDQFGSRRAEIMPKLRQAQTASFEGRIADAFKTTQDLIRYWGPAFRTKFLAFSANRRSAGAQAITFDSRVQVAWSILIKPLGWKELDPGTYEQICTHATQLVHRYGKRYGWETPSDLEACLFLFGREVGSHEGWLELVLAELGESFPATAVFDRLPRRTQTGSKAD